MTKNHFILHPRLYFKMLLVFFVTLFLFYICYGYYQQDDEKRLAIHVISLVFISLFGHARYLLPFFNLIYGLLNYKNKERESTFIKVILIYIFCVISIMFAMTDGWATPDTRWHISNGGIVGHAMYKILHYFVSDMIIGITIFAPIIFLAYKLTTGLLFNGIKELKGNIEIQTNIKLPKVKHIFADKNTKTIQKVLNDFDINAEVDRHEKALTYDQYLIKLGTGVMPSKIKRLEETFEMALSKKNIKIGLYENYVYIQVPSTNKVKADFKELIITEEFLNSKALSVPIGINVSSGEHVFDSIKEMPHLFIAGSSGSGKTVAINSIILSLALKNKPEDLELIIIDKKMRLNIFNDLPHLRKKVLSDDDEIIAVFELLVLEMSRRYKLMANQNFNFPNIILVADEIDDVFLTSRKKVQTAITRLAKLAREARIYMIFGTQRPSKDLINGHIQNNFTARMCLTVADKTESQRVIGIDDCFKLNGKGDMFYKSNNLKATRLQGYFIDNENLDDIKNLIAEINNKYNLVYKSTENRVQVRQEVRQIPSYIAKFDQEVKQEVRQEVKQEVRQIPSYTAEFDQEVRQEVKQEVRQEVRQQEVRQEVRQNVYNFVDYKTKKEEKSTNFSDSRIQFILLKAIRKNEISINLIRKWANVSSETATQFINELSEKKFISDSYANKPRIILISEEELKKLD